MLSPSVRIKWKNNTQIYLNQTELLREVSYFFGSTCLMITDIDGLSFGWAREK